MVPNRMGANDDGGYVIGFGYDLRANDFKVLTIRKMKMLLESIL